MITAILAAAVLLLGSGKRKKRKPSSAQPPIRARVLLPAGPQGEPWERCEPPSGSPKGTQAAFGKDGRCMVFWRPETASVVTQTIQKMLMELPESQRTELCAVSKCEDDPFALESQAFCKWVPDPNRTEFVKRVTMALWPQITPSMLPPPPPDNLGRIDCPYFVRYVWTRVMNIFAQEFCGFNPVT